MNLLRIAALCGILGVAAGAMACGDDNNDDKTPTGAASSPAATQTRSAAATTPAPAGTSGTGTSVSVTAQDFSFSPDEFKVSKTADTKISLKNSGSVQHTLTVYKDEDFKQPISGADTSRVSPGATGEFTLMASTFGDADDLYFRCEVHPSQMKGEITFQ